jgi:hypothetical protein
LRAALSLGRDIVNFAAFALADNPPQLSVIIMSAALGFLIDLLPGRPALTFRCGLIKLALDWSSLMPRIICIDTDSGAVKVPVDVLRSAGYEVMLAYTPEVGMALLRLFPPDVVLLDSHLADNVMAQIRMACPSAPVVVTGEKPVSVEELQWLASHQSTSVDAQDARHLTH